MRSIFEQGSLSAYSQVRLDDSRLLLAQISTKPLNELKGTDFQQKNCLL